MHKLFFFFFVASSLINAQDKTISLVAVGDIMMGTNYPSKKYLPSGNGSYLWEYVRESLQSADITFGNHEGVILTEGGTTKKCNNPNACYVFRTPEKYAFNLKEAGFDFLSLANNHANDFGFLGRENTQKNTRQSWNFICRFNRKIICNKRN